MHEGTIKRPSKYGRSGKTLVEKLLVRIPCGSKDDQVYKKNMNSWCRN
jgi:hypothetical protein